MPSMRAASAPASGGVAAFTGVTCSRPSRNSTPSSCAPPQVPDETFQPRIEFLPTPRQPFISRRGQSKFGGDRRYPVRRQQIAVEAAIVRRTVDPDISRTQLVTQRREHRGLIKPPVRPAFRGHQPLPFLAEWHRAHPPAHRATGFVEVTQQFERGQHRVVGSRGLEFQRLNQLGRELAQCHVAVGSTEQRIFLDQIGE